MKIRWAIARFLALFRKQDLDRELNDEVLAYLELAERDAIAQGLTPQAARRAARLDFGGIEQMKETHRDQRGVPWIENLVRDFRHGLSSLGRNPGFAVIAVGLLALGIGATTAVFTVVDAVLLEPLPFPEPGRIVRVWEYTAELAAERNHHSDLPGLETAGEPLRGLAALAWVPQLPRRSTVIRRASPADRSRPVISRCSEWSRRSGVPLLRGKKPSPGLTPVVVLSHRFWQTRLGGDPAVHQRELRLDGKPYRVIGVLPAGPFDRDKAEFWTPLVFAPQQLNRQQHWLQVVARLRPGVSLAQARVGMTALRARLFQSGDMPAWKKDWGFAVEPFAPAAGSAPTRFVVRFYLAFGAAF